MAEDSEGTAKKEEILESQIETAMRSRVSLFKEQSEWVTILFSNFSSLPLFLNH